MNMRNRVLGTVDAFELAQELGVCISRYTASRLIIRITYSPSLLALSLLAMA
jgi:hypothetical protein